MYQEYVETMVETSDNGYEPDESLTEADVEETDVATEDDGDVSNTSNDNDNESGDVEAPYFGQEGSESSVLTYPELENVAGFDQSVLAASRENLVIDEDNLLDAWYADLGDPVVGALLKRQELRESMTEVVIGTDDRKRITATTSFPWRSICSLLVTAQDGSRWIGTGWLVGHRTVITAGHVIYIHSRGGWVKSVEVIPGRNGSSRPYGSCRSSNLRSVKGWTKSKKRSHDYGAIILPKNCAYGKRVGYFGYGNYGKSTLKNLTVNLSGYPGDKPAGTQWWDARKIKSVNSRTLVYNIDTAGGQSGSPVWQIQNGKRYAVGIHTNGSSSGNSATRIVKPVFDNIKKWKNEGQLS